MHAQAMQLYTLENITYAKLMHAALCAMHTEHINMYHRVIKLWKILYNFDFALHVWMGLAMVCILTSFGEREFKGLAGTNQAAQLIGWIEFAVNDVDVSIIGGDSMTGCTVHVCPNYPIWHANDAAYILWNKVLWAGFHRGAFNNFIWTDSFGCRIASGK